MVVNQLSGATALACVGGAGGPGTAPERASPRSLQAAAREGLPEDAARWSVADVARWAHALGCVAAPRARPAHTDGAALGARSQKRGIVLQQNCAVSRQTPCGVNACKTPVG